MSGIVLDSEDIVKCKVTKSLILWIVEELDNKQYK